MKYVMDILLIVGLLWIGHLWNNQRKAVIEQDDQSKVLKVMVAQLEADLALAKQETEKTAADLAVAQDQLDQAADQLREKTDAVAAKDAEILGLRATAQALKARVAELQGYRDRARQAVVVEPAGSAGPAATGQ